MPHFIFKIMLPLIVIGAILTIVVVLFNRWLKFRERGWAFIMRQDNNKALASLRITAYERLTIMLERITPQSLIMRHNLGAANSALLQMELIKSIREEFDHNISLQIYVSRESWEKIKHAKEETTELIKVAFTRVRPESPAMELSREILKLEATVGNSAIRDAITAVRMEMAKYF